MTAPDAAVAPDAPANIPATVSSEVPLSLYGKLVRVAGSVKEVPKDGHNTEFNYSYATLGTVQAVLKPLLAAEGLLILPILSEHEKVDTGARSRSGTPNMLTRVNMTYRIVDSATGEWLDLPWLGEAMDFGDKGFAKALTISMRTFLNQLFQIPSYDEDTDPDRAAPQDQRDRGTRWERGDRQPVQRVTGGRGPTDASNDGRGNQEPPDVATEEMAGRLRVDQQGEPEQKKRLLNKISKHLRLLEMDEQLQVRLIQALTDGRGSKGLKLPELEELHAKVVGIKFMAEVRDTVEKYTARKQAEGGGDLFDGADQARTDASSVTSGPPAEGDQPAPKVPVVELPRGTD